jgi:hypothetical protein
MIDGDTIAIVGFFTGLLRPIVALFLALFT